MVTDGDQPERRITDLRKTLYRGAFIVVGVLFLIAAENW